MPPMGSSLPASCLQGFPWVTSNVGERAHGRVCSSAVERRRDQICGPRHPAVDSRLYNPLIRGHRSSNEGRFAAPGVHMKVDSRLPELEWRLIRSCSSFSCVILVL
jgi:hypothetical protein